MKRRIAVFMSICLIILAMPILCSAENDTSAVDVGLAHTVALTQYGRVYSAGDNTYGQCETWEWTDVAAIAAGENFTAAAKTDGTVTVIGDVSGLQVASWTDIIALSAGKAFLAGLRRDGSVVVTGEFSDASTVATWSNIASISAGYAHLAALNAEGECFAAGENEDGQCNVGGMQEEQWGQNVQKIVAGGRNTIALMKNGTVAAAGSVYDPTETWDGTTWTGVTDIAVAKLYVIAIKADGTTVTDAPTSETLYHSSALSTNVSSIVIGYPATDTTSHMIIRGTDQTLRGISNQADTSATAVSSWKLAAIPLQRWNNVGERLFASIDELIAVQSDGSIVGSLETFAGTPTNYDGWDNLVYIATNPGAAYIAAIAADGTLYTSGTDSATNQSAIAGWRGIVKLSISYTHIMGLRWDGKVFSTLQQDNDINNMDSVHTWPVGMRDIVALSNCSVARTAQDKVLAYMGNKGQVTLYATTFKLLSESERSNVASLYGGFRHLAVQKNDGTYVFAGRNDAGQCNDNLATWSTAAAWNDVVRIVPSYNNTLALLRNGKVIAADDNADYILDTTDYAEIFGWTDVVHMVAAKNFVAAIDGAGRILVSGNTGNRPTHTKATAKAWNFYRKPMQITVESVTPLENALQIGVLYENCNGELPVEWIAGYDAAGRMTARKRIRTQITTSVQRATYTVPCVQTDGTQEIMLYDWGGGIKPQRIPIIYTKSDGGENTWTRK